MNMKKLRCDKPYDIDEARKRKGLSRRKRKDSRTTAYELTIRIPEEYRTYFDGKKKLTRTVFALNRKDDLKTQIDSFEDEKNAVLERGLEERGWVRQDGPKRKPGCCMTPLGTYIERYIEIRSNGSVSEATIKHEKGFLKYIDATIGSIPICKVTAENIEECLLRVPELSEKWALERQAAWEESRKTVRWAKKHGTLKKPFKPIRIAGPDMQSKILKFLREVMNYALEKDDIAKNTAKAKFLTRVFKKSKPLIDPLMADEAMRFLEAVLKLPLSWVKLSFLALFCTGIRPEEMQALMPGSFLFTGPEPATRITSAVKRGGVKIEDYPKTDAGRRTIPSDSILADTAKEWIAVKSQMIEDMGLMPTMRMPLMSEGPRPYAYNTWRKHWVKFIEDNGFEGIRPYSLRHTFATLNLANGENIKTVSVLMGHESPSYTLDLYAGYVPNTAMGIGSRYIDYIRSAGQDCGFIY